MRLRCLALLFCVQILLSCGTQEESGLSGDVSSMAAKDAAQALQSYYDGNALWSGGWWQSANAVTALSDYMRLSGDRSHLWAVEKTFEKHKGGGFLNEYFDDQGWWGLAWIRAYDLTGSQKYLDAAVRLADDMYQSGWDNTCGGGIWWSRKKETKNAIENALFIKLAAALHNRRPLDGRFLQRAQKAWNWFYASGLVDDRSIVADKLIECAREQLSPAWTYNQGVILGAAAELFRATKDSSYLDRAKKTALATITYVSANGILIEATDASCGVCSGDERLFKGAFVRNLREFYHARPDSVFSEYLRKNAESAYLKARSSQNFFGFHWNGPFDRRDAGRQTSGLDLMNALFAF